jgi:DNA-binding NtrC family response regulator
VVHERSSRRNHPFVTVSCSAQSIEALMQELFGDESGTADTTRRRGRLEAAAGGTLFLDEVAELPLEVQARLLRFLKEKTIERNGADRLRVDVRVMAATRANLVREVEAGRFRDDLYYHLQVLTLDVPALRDRERDVEQLAQYFFEKFAIEKGRNLKGFSDKAVEVLQAHDWPGNVREVMNRVRRAIVMCDKRIISPQDLGLNAAAVCGRVLTLDRAREEAERVAILASLKQTRHNVSRAARLLGVSRVTLYRLMDKHSINT